MTSIFRLIFLRFLVMLGLSFLGTFVTRSIITRSPGVDTSLMESQLQHALDLHRTSGPQEIGSYLSRLGRAQRSDVYVVDSSGKDVVDGADRSALLKRQNPGFQIPYLG